MFSPVTTIETRETGDKHYYKRNTTSQTARSVQLQEKYKRLFANKQIVCIEYQDLPDTDEREIFQVVSAIETYLPKLTTVPRGSNLEWHLPLQVSIHHPMQ